jgi:hypothetical protein
MRPRRKGRDVPLVLPHLDGMRMIDLSGVIDRIVIVTAKLGPRVADRAVFV